MDRSFPRKPVPKIHASLELLRGSVNMGFSKETLVAGEGSDKAVLEGAGA